MKKSIKIGVIGLGYVGFPLAHEFSNKFQVKGYDLSVTRVKELQNNIDITGEIDLSNVNQSLSFTNNYKDLSGCNYFIVTVPTPVDESNKPDLTYLEKASNDIAKVIKQGDTVIYESTVYPGATEEVCIPILESISSMKLNKDFFVGYSPERINPGDKEHKLQNIKKVVSGSNEDSCEDIYNLYSSIITAGVHKASSIKVAEASKVIENTQRDINIALMNELAIIFDKLDIDTKEVLDAASTKWNFLPFKPGLVGGHCIGVDPYYLSYKAELEGYWPEIVLAGRRINNNMASFIVSRLIETMIDKSINIKNSQVLVMGLTFKENCPDIRNSKVFDVIYELERLNIKVDVYDPNVDTKHLEVKHINFVSDPKINTYDGLILAVKHKQFIDKGKKNIQSYMKKKSAIFDVTSSFNKDFSDKRL
jgi:UDP-N-acetyl-D-glucosamine/UDP-N-acetyl-D-galactosamine dehydrogenase